MEGVLDRLAELVGISGWEIRKRNVIRPGDVWGPGQIMDDGCRRRRGLPRRDQAGATTRPAPPARRSGSGSGSRTPASATASARCPAPSCASARRRPGRGPPRLDRDGPGRAHRRAAGRRAGARHRPGPHRRHRRHHPRARLRPDHRVARHADGAPARCSRRARRRWPTAAGPTSTTTASTSSTGPHKLGDPANPTPDDPRRVRLRRPAGRRSTARPGKVERVVAVHDVGKAVNPHAVRGPDRGQRAHGPRLRADRGLPDRSRRPASRRT